MIISTYTSLRPKVQHERNLAIIDSYTSLRLNVKHGHNSVIIDTYTSFETKRLNQIYIFLESTGI